MEIITQQQTLFSFLAALFGLALSFGIGASGAASLMGTAVGGGAISVRQALALAAVMEFAGAYLAGGQVAGTVAYRIIDGQHVAVTPQWLVLVMLAALLAAGGWLLLASARGWPVAVSHALIGALCGAGIAAFDVEAINWLTIVEIGFVWLLAPVLGTLLALLLTMSCRRLIFNTTRPVVQAGRWMPLYAFLVGWSVTEMTVVTGLQHVDIRLPGSVGQSLAIVIGLAVAWAARRLILAVGLSDPFDRDSQHAHVERLFLPQLILTGAALAFAHGSNEVALAIGPLVAVLQIVSTGEMPGPASVTPLPLLIGSLGIVAGLALYGPRVMATVGRRITALTPSRAYGAAVATALVTVAASAIGLPLATAHVAVGAVIGVGVARGIGALDWRVIGGIVGAWLTTVPLCALVAALIVYSLRALFF